MTACHVKGTWLVIHKTGNVRINVTLSHLRPTPVAVEKQYYILRVCIFSLSYPACNTHAPYCHLWPVPLYHIFPHYHIYRTIFRKSLLNTKYVFRMSVQLFPKTFFIPRWIQRGVINLHRSSCKVPVLLVRHWRNLNFLDRFSREKKCSNIKFHKHPSSGSRVIPCGRTDRQRGSRKEGQPNMSKLVVAFQNFADAPKNSVLSTHTALICSVYISEQTATIYLYSITWLVFFNSGVCLLRGTNWTFTYNSVQNTK
jgi:hypothetical protein